MPKLCCFVQLGSWYANIITVWYINFTLVRCKIDSKYKIPHAVALLFAILDYQEPAGVVLLVCYKQEFDCVEARGYPQTRLGNRVWRATYIELMSWCYRILRARANFFSAIRYRMTSSPVDIILLVNARCWWLLCVTISATTILSHSLNTFFFI